MALYTDNMTYEEMINENARVVALMILYDEIEELNESLQDIVD